jgi:hypothetical protein
MRTDTQTCMAKLTHAFLQLLFRRQKGKFKYRRHLNSNNVTLAVALLVIFYLHLSHFLAENVYETLVYGTTLWESFILKALRKLM